MDPYLENEEACPIFCFKVSIITPRPDITQFTIRLACVWGHVFVRLCGAKRLNKLNVLLLTCILCVAVLQVKPGMPYLDVIRRLKESSHLPISAYHVSGEYAMMKAAVERGWLDERAAVLEVTNSLSRWQIN